jgi:hypothetical protein
MIYEWADGSHFSAFDAQELAPLVIGKTAEEIVRAARPKRSPLHRAIYRGSDAQEAQRARLERARLLVRSIVVVGGDQEMSRAAIAVHGRYERTTTVLSDEEMRAAVVATAWRELEAWHRKYGHVTELAEAAEIVAAALDARGVLV